MMETADCLEKGAASAGGSRISRRRVGPEQAMAPGFEEAFSRSLHGSLHKLRSQFMMYGVLGKEKGEQQQEV